MGSVYQVQLQHIPMRGRCHGAPVIKGLNRDLAVCVKIILVGVGAQCEHHLNLVLFFLSLAINLSNSSQSNSVVQYERLSANVNSVYLLDQRTSTAKTTTRYSTVQLSFHFTEYEIRMQITALDRGRMFSVCVW